VITPVSLLSKDRIYQLPERAREVVEYRKHPAPGQQDPRSEKSTTPRRTVRSVSPHRRVHPPRQPVGAPPSTATSPRGDTTVPARLPRPAYDPWRDAHGARRSG
jgi:hypothetical protein